MFISFKPFKKCRLQRQRNKVNLSPCAQLSDLVHHMLIRHALAFIAFREKGHEAKSPASEVIRFLICVFFSQVAHQYQMVSDPNKEIKDPWIWGVKNHFHRKKRQLQGVQWLSCYLVQHGNQRLGWVRFRVAWHPESWLLAVQDQIKKTSNHEAFPPSDLKGFIL